MSVLPPPILKMSALSPIGVCQTLPATEKLLLAGGDARIAANAKTGLNQYGCSVFPDTGLSSFASSTASTISEAGFVAADSLRDSLVQTLSSDRREAGYSQAQQLLRTHLMDLCGLANTPQIEVIFAASGTDLHLIAGQFVAADTTKPTLTIMLDSAETGSGVVAALRGRQGGVAKQLEVVTVPVRSPDGTPRPIAEVDAEFETITKQAIADGQRVLLVLVDHSKTGLIAPSPACAATLHQRYLGKLEVLVDACQFRIAPATLRAYLVQDFMVAITGSKFVTGPSFCGALFIPAAVTRRLAQRPLPIALLPYAEQITWFKGWKPERPNSRGRNYGLLLRWEAALAELRAFRAVPEQAVAAFLQAFASAVKSRLNSDPHFEELAVATLDRSPLIAAQSWDHMQSVFPFILKRPGAFSAQAYLNREETLQVYRALPIKLPDDGTLNSAVLASRFQLGQAVKCGHREGIAISALRMCASARLIVEACSSAAKQAEVIARAIAALDKTALLVDMTRSQV